MNMQADYDNSVSELQKAYQKELDRRIDEVMCRRSFVRGFDAGFARKFYTAADAPFKENVKFVDEYFRGYNSGINYAKWNDDYLEKHSKCQ